MKELVLDVETTTFQKGNPFSRQNRLILGGLFDGTSSKYFGEGISTNLDPSDLNSILLIGFNIKFDLHWIKRTYGTLFHNISIWDCQLAEFLLSNQREPFPNLDSVANRYALGTKLDTIKTKYWDNGIDTDQVPIEELQEYLDQDLKLTYELYKQQQIKLKEAGLLPLFRLQCADLIVLEEMEWNGIKLDTTLCLEKEKETEEELKNIDISLKNFHDPNLPINYNSRDHLSCLLYGGTIIEDVRIPVGVYKTGEKVGLPRYKILTYEHELPRLIEPLKGSELLKEGYYSTNDETLRQLRTTKKFKSLIQLILRRAELSKIQGTYYRGLPNLINEMDWKPGYLYGQLNQCVAVTGRLSASKPNQQNFAGDVKECLITRF